MSRPSGERSYFWHFVATSLLAVVAIDVLAGWNTRIPTALAIVSILAVVRERHYWRLQVGDLRDRLKAVRSGQESLDHLIGVAGGMSALSNDIYSVLTELREQKKAIVELEHEMRDRVANRTSALESQLNTVRIQAQKDTLTGLFNRRMMDECLPKLLDRCRAGNQELTLLAIDVDRFKALNDTLGHAAGDSLLKSIGQILRSGIREGDVAIRTGGDEFIVLLPGCPVGPARALGGRLAAMVDGLARTLGVGHPPSLSVGAATLAELPAGAGQKELLEAADKDLYIVKASRKRIAA